jgi:hypothetical protein
MLGLIAIAIGYIELARSPLASGQSPAQGKGGEELSDQLQHSSTTA